MLIAYRLQNYCFFFKPQNKFNPKFGCMVKFMRHARYCNCSVIHDKLRKLVESPVKVIVMQKITFLPSAFHRHQSHDTSSGPRWTSTSGWGGRCAVGITASCVSSFNLDGQVLTILYILRSDNPRWSPCLHIFSRLIFSRKVMTHYLTLQISGL